MFICAGESESFNFATAVGIGMIDVSINLTKICIENPPPFILFVAATKAVIAPISIAIDRYIAQVIGFVISYHDTTCDIDIKATNMIGRRNIDLLGLFLTQFKMFFILHRFLTY